MSLNKKLCPPLHMPSQTICRMDTPKAMVLQKKTPCIETTQLTNIPHNHQSLDLLQLSTQVKAPKSSVNYQIWNRDHNAFSIDT